MSVVKRRLITSEHAHHTYATLANLEAVNVHAGQTTTSELSHLGIITKPKRKLITSETLRPEEVVVADLR